MALQWRQVRRYVSKATIYRRETFGDERYTKIAEHVPCAIKPTDNYDQVTGRTILVKQDSVQTSDSIHFEANVDIGPEDYVFIELDSKQRPGEWYQTTGAPEIHEFRANFLRIYVNNAVPLKPEQIVS